MGYRVRKPRRASERGATLAEFALMLPVLMAIIAGVIEMGMLFNAWVAVQDAAERGTRYAVTGRSSCSSGGSSRLTCITSEAQTAVKHIKDNATAVTVTVNSWNYPTYTTLAANNPGGPCDAVEVAVTYAYKPRITLFTPLIGTRNLTGRQRFINEPFGPCLWST